MAYRMTAARRTALRKAQLASARKRKKGYGKKRSAKALGILTAGVAVAVAGSAAYRRYDFNQEFAQEGYLARKAHVIQAKTVKRKYGAETWRSSGDAHIWGVQPRQPRRYRGKPSHMQTKRGIQNNREKVFGKRIGKAMNKVDNMISVKYNSLYQKDVPSFSNYSSSQRLNAYKKIAKGKY